MLGGQRNEGTVTGLSMGMTLKAIPVTKAVSTCFSNCALVLRCGKLRLSLSERVAGGAYCRFSAPLKAFLSMVQTSYGRFGRMSVSRTLNPLRLHGDSRRSRHPIGPAPSRRPHLGRHFESFLGIDGTVTFSKSSLRRILCDFSPFPGTGTHPSVGCCWSQSRVFRSTLELPALWHAPCRGLVPM